MFHSRKVPKTIDHDSPKPRPEEKERASRKQPSKKRRVAYFLSWLLIWPSVLLIPVMMIGGALIVNLLNSMPDKIIYAVQLSIFIIVTFLVIILLFTKILLSRRKRLFLRMGGVVLGGYIWLGVLFSGVLMLFATYELYRGQIALPEITRDDHLVEVIENIGGSRDNLKNVLIKYVDSYNEKNKAGEYSPEYNGDNTFAYATISVLEGQKTEDEKITVAHEYLHHIWEIQLDYKTQQSLTSQLVTLYGDDEYMKQRVASYSDTDMLIPTELFSFYCTESSDRFLTPYVLKQCNKYINRSTLQLPR
jgi:hypothetical protein